VNPLNLSLEGSNSCTWGIGVKGQFTVATYATSGGIVNNYAVYCKFTKESSSPKSFEIRLRFDRAMAMSFCSLCWPTLYIFLFFLDGTFCAIKQQRKLLRLSTSSEKLLELPNPYPRAMLQNTCETSAGVYPSSVGPMGQQCQMHHQQVESVQRNAAHFTCRDYRRTSSVTKCCRSCSGIHTSSQEVAISILDQKV